MAALTALRQDVLPHVPGCPLPIVDDAILKTVIAFCNRSRAWRFTPADITAIPGTANYTVPDLPVGTSIAWLLSANLDGLPLELLDPSSVPQSFETETRTPVSVVVFSETQIGLRPVPDANSVLSFKIALRPSLAATAYPDEFHNNHQEGIAQGVLSRLWANPNKPWSAPKMVADARSQYESAILDAAHRADRGNSNAPSRTSLSLISGR